MLLAALLGAAQRGSAHAQDVAIAPTATPGSFATLDRVDAHTRAGFDFSYLVLKTTNSATYLVPKRTILRLEFYGQIARALADGSTAGWYGHFPLGVGVFDNRANGEVAPGNVEVGAFYSVPIKGLELVLRGGFVSPTADTSPAASVVLGLGTFARITDRVGSLPNITTLRFSASPILRHRWLILRADIGVDVLIDKPANSNADPMFRLNVGVGADLKRTMVTAEFVTIGELTGRGDLSSTFLHTFAVHGEFKAGALHPGLSFVFPLDSEINRFVSVIIMTSLQAVF